MLELPEVLTLTKQVNEVLKGKTVKKVLPASKPHKFCWYNGDPAYYEVALTGSTVTAAEGFGMFVDILFDSGSKLCIDDGVNIRFMPMADAPKNYQLLIEFEDGDCLVFTVAMYGGIQLHDDNWDNDYYKTSKAYVSPFSEGFKGHFRKLLDESKLTLSAKAFIATEQRFPGVGNGVCQDILFAAGMNPKRKINTLSEEDRERLCSSMVSVLRKMVEGGGRDTEKDLFGEPGKYASVLSKNTYQFGCPVCGGGITKEAYLGGSVYYCPHCQPLVK